MQHISRHDIGELSPWLESLSNTRGLREVILARPASPADAADLLRCNLDMIALSSLTERTCHDLPLLAEEGAAAAAAAALVSTQKEGEVAIELEWHGARKIPLGDGALTPTLWRDGLMLACAVGDYEAVTTLCSPATIDVAQFPTSQAAQFWRAMCEVFACVATSPAEMLKSTSRALTALDEVGPNDKRIVSALERALLELAVASTLDDGARWTQALTNALQAHAAHFDTDANRYRRIGLVSVVIAGLCAIASTRGLQVEVVSHYAPSQLINIQQRGPERRVRFKAIAPATS